MSQLRHPGHQGMPARLSRKQTDAGWPKATPKSNQPTSTTHYAPSGAVPEPHLVDPQGRQAADPPAAPPGGRFWHGFAVRLPPVWRAGGTVTFGHLDAAARISVRPPMQILPSLDNRGMERNVNSGTFFTERSLAAYLAVSDRTIRNWIRRGELPSYKLGAARRIDPADVEDFLARKRDETA